MTNLKLYCSFLMDYCYLEKHLSPNSDFYLMRGLTKGFERDRRFCSVIGPTQAGLGIVYLAKGFYS